MIPPLFVDLSILPVVDSPDLILCVGIIVAVGARFVNLGVEFIFPHVGGVGVIVLGGICYIESCEVGFRVRGAAN